VNPTARGAAICLVLGLAGGLWLGGHPASLPGPLRDAFVEEQVASSAEAQEAIRETYFRRVDPAVLRDASAQGMVARLRRRFKDRFSHYFNARQYARFREVTSGHFSGVGLSVADVKRGLRVASVFEGSPASRAGIRRGEVVIAVNGRSIAGLDSRLATARIKGPAGTTVRLTVTGPRGRRELTLERADLSVPIAKGRMRRVGGRRVAHVALAEFTPGAHGKLRQEIERLYRRDAEGLVLDLRGNGGGLLTEAVLVSSQFVEDGVIVTTSGRTQGRRVYRATGDALEARPMAVLIDRGTASAAEILAAALRDHGLAKLVGQRTFGKGMFQRVLELGDGGALSLTVGVYLTPEGHSLQRKGVRPDLSAPDDPATGRDESLDRALATVAGELRE
jgi:carboxyl-terminal processing protease